MGQTAKPPRQNRTLTVDFHNETTSYGQNIGTHHFPDVYGLTLDLASS